MLKLGNLVAFTLVTTQKDQDSELLCMYSLVLLGGAPLKLITSYPVRIALSCSLG